MKVGRFTSFRLLRAWSALGLLLLFLTGCIPETAPRQNLAAQGQTPGEENQSTNNSEVLANFNGETRNFFELLGIRTFDVLTLPLTSSDSTILWGEQIQTRLQALNSSSKVCLVAQYTHVTPNRLLIMSAVRRRSVLGTQVTPTGTVTTVGYSWLLFPNDQQKNQSDCLTAGMIAARNLNFGATAVMAFSLTEACNNCTSSPLSAGLKGYFDSGASLDGVDLSALKIKMQTGNTNPTNGQTCSADSQCRGIGYSCCLENQCVIEKAIKNGVDLLSAEYLAAKADVDANPGHYTRYPQFYYICPLAPPPPPEEEPVDNEDFEVMKRFNERRDLFTCLNPQFDEIGYCATRFENVKTRIASSVVADKTFSASKDDNNMRWANSSLSTQSIYSVRYGEEVLYQEGLSGYDSTNVPGSHIFPGVGNDNLTAAQSVEVYKTISTTIPDDTLVVVHKVDATCEKLSSTLARCKKTYIQGQVSTTPRPSDHPSSSFFALPSYANLTSSYPPSVKVGETVVPEDSTSTWRVQGNGISFVMPVTTNQTVQITYYVTAPTDLDALVAGKAAAQAKVNTICQCGTSLKCNLELKTTTTSGNTISEYICKYPSETLPQDPPAVQQVFVPSKAVPSRYFDINGTVWDNDSGANAPAQEGIEFKYTNNDSFKPNNTTSYVGFHEIYGSFNKTANAPKPPRIVALKKDRLYDIFVNDGAFSSCQNCGSDPYNPVLRLFPDVFTDKAGGYRPDLVNSSRLSSTGTLRADDLLFGRACFVPATMLPWTHAAATTVTTQRQRRLAAQHLMFANGYSRDWFGFDYGSLIGSFDGVTWFSIGNQRRIKANGNRLLLAVNAWFGDLTTENSYKVVVSEAIPGAGSGSSVTHDTLSDGAQCQKSHYCSNDNDCIAQLGYDYTCQNVTALTTPWPQFDTAANEVVGSQTRTISSLINGVNGQSRRCVYRGRGAPCELNLASLIPSFNGTELVGTSSCSPNNHCASVDTGSRFNTSISRFAASPLSQNTIGGLGVKDTVGLGARVIGRPLDFFGTKTTSSVNSTSWGFTSTTTLREHLKDQTGVKGMCLPGRDVANSTTFTDVHSRVPASSEKEAADRMFGVGATVKLSTSTTSSSKLLAMCPATTSGTFNHFNVGTSLTDPTLNAEAVRQNVMTSLMDMTEYANLNLINTNAGTAATSTGYQRYACMRSAGAGCFSDLECAPNSFISTKMRSLSSWGNFAGNLAEQAFWKEELICGNPEPTKLFDNTTNTFFNTKDNRCCRANAQTIKTYTQFDADTSFVNCAGTNLAVPGVTTAVNASSRNPRNSIVYDKATCNPPESGKTPALVSPSPRSSTDLLMSLDRINKQYETLDTMNQRMCCTGNWVRSFSTENGGGHQWGQGREQNIDKAIFASWNWYYDQKFTTVLDEALNMECSNDNFGTQACEIRNLNETQSKNYLDWIALFELVGIPQVMIPTPGQNGVLERLVNETNNAQSSLEGQGQALRNTLKPIVYSAGRPDLADVSDGGSQYFVSAASYTKMEMGGDKLKKVFSENEFNCCTPAGGRVPQGATANTCCTGTLTNQDGALRCCLDDYSNVSVYLNRYVSSEGRGLPSNMYDPKTGFITDPGQVYSIARAKNLCCSGNIVAGTVVHNMFIPLQNGTRNPLGKSRRFAYRSDAIDNNSETGPIGDIYDEGIRWNTHFYCAPADYTAPTTSP